MSRVEVLYGDTVVMTGQATPLKAPYSFWSRVAEPEANDQWRTLAASKPSAFTNVEVSPDGHVMLPPAFKVRAVPEAGETP